MPELTDRETLAGWIQPKHLEADMISTYRASFSSHPARMVVIPGFLRDDVADRLSRFLLNEAEYHAEYGIYSVEGAFAEERYLAAGDSDRFFRLHRLAGIPEQHRFSMNALTYLQLRDAFQQPAFEAYFEELTGLELGASDDFGVHSMRTGDYLRAHADDTVSAYCFGACRITPTHRRGRCSSPRIATHWVVPWQPVALHRSARKTPGRWRRG